METRLLQASDPAALDEAVSLLHKGGLVAFPTDTVYGLGALVLNAQAISHMFMVKGRDTSKSIAVLIGELDAFERVSGTPAPLARRLAAAFWPGALTLVVHRNLDLPSILSPQPTVGVRMPDHPVALHLLKMAGPLAVTSANLSGSPNALTAQEVFEQLHGLIPLILDGGQTPGGLPSTVVNCTGDEPVILREGPITLQQLQSEIS